MFIYYIIYVFEILNILKYVLIDNFETIFWEKPWPAHSYLTFAWYYLNRSVTKRLYSHVLVKASLKTIPQNWFCDSELVIKFEIALANFELCFKLPTYCIYLEIDMFIFFRFPEAQIFASERIFGFVHQACEKNFWAQLQ